ncbi:hypothetical protein E4U55_000734 [Claviceps digitariae]|nr:hypothetical protein E4U55_000734 [Claviceps digitariae]
MTATLELHQRRRDFESASPSNFRHLTLTGNCAMPTACLRWISVSRSHDATTDAKEIGRLGVTDLVKTGSQRSQQHSTGDFANGKQPTPSGQKLEAGKPAPSE